MKSSWLCTLYTKVYEARREMTMVEEGKKWTNANKKSLKKALKVKSMPEV